MRWTWPCSLNLSLLHRMSGQLMNTRIRRCSLVYQGMGMMWDGAVSSAWIRCVHLPASPAGMCSAGTASYPMRLQALGRGEQCTTEMVRGMGWKKEVAGVQHAGQRFLWRIFAHCMTIDKHNFVIWTLSPPSHMPFVVIISHLHTGPHNLGILFKLLGRTLGFSYSR